MLLQVIGQHAKRSGRPVDLAHGQDDGVIIIWFDESEQPPMTSHDR
jgi:hypothetical protein